jgi:hypothetical protein
LEIESKSLLLLSGGAYEKVSVKKLKGAGNMKKNYSIFLFLLFLLLTTGCSTFRFDNDTLSDEVETIEIIEIKDTTNGKEVSILKTFDTKQLMDELLINISELEYNQLYGDPEPLRGICFKLIYKNGDYEIIGKRKIEKYNKSDKPIYAMSKYCSGKEFNSIIDKCLS